MPLQLDEIERQFEEAENQQEGVLIHPQTILCLIREIKDLRNEISAMEEHVMHQIDNLFDDLKSRRICKKNTISFTRFWK